MVHSAALVAIGHLDRTQDRDPRLIAAAIHTSIPCQSPRRDLVETLFAAVILRTEMVLLERTRRLQIFECRHCAVSRLIELFSSKLHGKNVGGCEGMIQIVA